MSEIEALRAKFDELETVLKLVKELEKRQRSNVRSYYQKQQLIASVRATTYVMLYNALEGAMRSLMKSIREKIEEDGVLFGEATEYWQLDLVQSTFLDRMQNGTSHGNILTEFVPLTNQPLSWDEVKKDRLPFSGNFGQASALRLKDGLAINWSAPPHTLGGSDLDNVRERRNALAHGLESFSEAGGEVLAKDLLDMLDRVRKFMLSYVAALESYRDTQGYVKQPGAAPNNIANPGGIADSFEAEPLQTGE